MMPEIRDLSEALPELPMDPITGVGVVVSRNRAPTGYEVSHLGNVLVDMKLIDIKDTLPVGFIPMQETVDTPMDGVPFMISEKFACASNDMQQVDLMGITIKSLAEIEEEYDYSFRTEQSAAARLPPSPSRGQLSPES
ncbi:UNVERIFIED_CONTAM: hypothetical protein FKN15_044210 [Acipenser sinensis]